MMVTAGHCYTCTKDTNLYIKTANMAILKTLYKYYAYIRTYLKGIGIYTSEKWNVVFTPESSVDLR